MEVGITELIEGESLFVWLIKDYVKLMNIWRDTEKKMESSVFTDRCSRSGRKWELNAYPRRVKVEGANANYFQLYLEYVDIKSTPTLNITTRFTFNLSNDNGSFKELSLTHEFNPKELDWGWSDFLSEKSLLDNLSEGETLKVQCRLWIQYISSKRVEADDFGIPHDVVKEINHNP